VTPAELDFLQKIKNQTPFILKAGVSTSFSAVDKVLYFRLAAGWKQGFRMFPSRSLTKQRQKPRAEAMEGRSRR